MIRHWLGASAALLVILAPALSAQEAGAGQSPGRRTWVRPEGFNMFGVAGGRPRIGVTIALNDDAEARGARIDAVTPDGPAAEAGLRKDDIITRFGGTDLSGPEAGRRLVELAQQLEPGDTVKVEYRRGNGRRNATIVARDLGGAYAFGRIEEMMPALEGLRTQVAFMGGMPGLSLAKVNEGLGEYFGTSKGVLVLAEPADSSLPLRAGDVIVSIDGREPQSVSHAMRIIGSYAPGESLRFEVMRQKRSQTLEWKVSEHRMGAPGFNGMHREPLRRPAVRLRETEPARGT
jgi:S1-C subfamily serine protease